MPDFTLMEKNKKKLILRVNYKDPLAIEKIAGSLAHLISSVNLEQKDCQHLVLCIGSDRSTGDALGPLVGTFLAPLRLPKTMIWGTLAEPVHALNLSKYMQQMQCFQDIFTIAVDASLGKLENVGSIELGAGPLLPGSGVNKALPPVGDIHLSGIVNLGGFMEQVVLQSTRLYKVMGISEIMAKSLQKALSVV